MILEKIKSKIWLISIPVAIAALLSMSAIKDIEDAHVELDLGKKTSYYRSRFGYDRRRSRKIYQSSSLFWS